MSWSANEWEAFGVVAQALLTGGAALGALYTYRRERRSESARWTEEQLDVRLLGEASSKARTDLEFFFNERLELYIQAQLTGVPPANVLSGQQISDGVKLDSFVIGLEHILNLRERKAIRKHDLEGDFSYWSKTLLCHPEYASLRLYLDRFDFRLLARQVPSEDPRRVAVYGTLEPGLAVDNTLLPRMKLETGGLKVPGQLFDAGDYPAAIVDLAAIAGKKSPTSYIEVDVYLLDQEDDLDEALGVLDRYEETSATDWSGLYRRLYVPIGTRGAWIYDWCGPTDSLQALPEGRWPRSERPDVEV